MHRNEGPNVDTTSVPGSSLAKTSPLPATTINPEHWNAATQELINVIIDAGLTIAASAEADRTAGWAQLKDAIRVVANKRLSEDLPYTGAGNYGGMTAAPVDIAVTSSVQTRTPSRFLNRFTTALGVPCVVSLTENDGNFANQIIICQNFSAQTMIIAGVLLQPGTAAFYRYEASNSGGSKWVALRPKNTDDILEGASQLFWTASRFDTRLATKSTADLAEGSNLYYTDPRVTARIYNDLVTDAFTQGLVTGLANTAFAASFAAIMPKSSFTIEIRGAANNELLGSGTARYFVHDKLVTLIIPILSTGTATTVTHNAFHLRGPSDTDLPAAIRGALALTSAQLSMTVNGTPELGSWYVHGDDYVTLYRAAHADFASGSGLTTEAFSIQYPIS